MSDHLSTLDSDHQAKVHDEIAERVLLDALTEGPLPEGLPGYVQHLSAHRFAVDQALAGGHRVLDYGCGTGYLTVLLARAGKRVDAFDISRVSIKVTRQRATTAGIEARTVVADAGLLPYPEKTFDVVVGLAVLHHLSPDALIQALRETRSVLAPSGRAIFLEPVEDWPLWDRLQQVLPGGAASANRPSILCYRRWKAWKDQEHDRNLTSLELAAAGREVGLKVSLRPFGILNRIDNWVSSLPVLRAVTWIDDAMMVLCPPLRRMARNVVMTLERD